MSCTAPSRVSLNIKQQPSLRISSATVNQHPDFRASKSRKTFSTAIMRWATILVGLLETCAAVQTVNRKACQQPSKKPLDGCPKNTLLVGLGQKYATIQSAVLSLPNNTTPHYILILPGNYTEQVNVTRPGPVFLFGQTKSPNDQTKNAVNVLWANATGGTLSTLDNAYTSVLTVAPTFNASTTGSGPTGNPVPANTPFGNTDFRAYNLNFINNYQFDAD